MHRSTGIGVSRWLGGLLGVALALPALALPQGCIELLAQAPRVDVVQGQQRDLRLAVPIERLAIGDPKIADVQCWIVAASWSPARNRAPPAC